MQYFLSLIISFVTLTACADNEPAIGENSGGAWFEPSPTMTWHWQLSGVVNEGYEVDLYDIDLFDSSSELIARLQARGIKVICYFSAGSFEDWRSDADLFNASELGNNLGDWPGERWLDIRSENVRAIMKLRLDLAVSKNCDGVEPDNVDGYTNSPGFNFTASDQLNYNRFLANEAHARNLAIGLKNDLDQVIQLVDYFDFAVNEQCFEYGECNLLKPFISQKKAVFIAEYQQSLIDNEAERLAVCKQSSSNNFSTLILPLNLDDSFRIAC